MFKKKIMRGGIALEPGSGEGPDIPFEELPAPRAVVIPLVQRQEPPARPVVKAGDHVAAGQILGEAAGPGGAPVHASVSGVVTRVSRCLWSRDPLAAVVAIESDGRDEFASPIPYNGPWSEAGPGELIETLRLSGIIDWNGGTGAPVHEKLAAAQGGGAGALVINFLSTESWCSSAWMAGAGESEKFAAGIALCRKIAGAAECVIVAGEREGRLLGQVKGLDGVRIAVVRKPRYPMHEERFVSRAALRGVVVSAATVLAIRDAVEELTPCVARTVTVAGPAVTAPKRLKARVGTPYRLLLEACGADLARLKKLVDGGPVSGVAVPDIDMPVTKATAALLALDRAGSSLPRLPCIGCRRCYAVCPVRLEPALLAQLARAGDTRELARRGVAECIECGCCAYVCPSKINLVHSMQFGKSLAGTETKERV